MAVILCKWLRARHSLQAALIVNVDLAVASVLVPITAFVRGDGSHA